MALNYFMCNNACLYHRYLPIMSTSKSVLLNQLCRKSFSRVVSQEKVDFDANRKAFADRSQLKEAKRIIVKIGSAIVTDENFKLSTPRLASIVEQIAKLHQQGREMLLVSSGSVSFGRKMIKDELQMAKAMRETASYLNLPVKKVSEENRAAAAVGQTSLMSFYESLFKQYDCTVAQVLVTNENFRDVHSRRQLKNIISDLLDYKIIPIINTNDAVEATIPTLQPDGVQAVRLADMKDIIIGDNDALASILSAELSSDLLLILSNVDGLYSGPPERKESRFFSTLSAKMFCKDSIKYGSKSNVGLGGMESKIQSALWAVRHGTSVIICSGMKENSIMKTIDGDRIGTFINNQDDDMLTVDEPGTIASYGSKQLISIGTEQRAKILNEIADALQLNKSNIFAENKIDLIKAESDEIDDVLLSRLKLTDGKIDTLSIGLRQIAKKTLTEVDTVLQETKISDTLTLKKVTCPIGVLLVIFESRPDCLPQISGLSIATGNGLLLKGGSEAKYSNAYLFSIIHDILAKYKCQDAIQLINSREKVSQLLMQEQKIDLIIPRGSNQLVNSIQKQAKGIPVLAHADGICHVYIDSEANLDRAIKVVLDSKCDYPAACNAMETLLIHKSLIDTDFFKTLCKNLKAMNVKVNMGSRIAKDLPFNTEVVSNYKIEYGDLECTLESVDSLEDAIDHINTYGSKHTDAIITENVESAKFFQLQVDSACTFVNASTRFADGFRFGLGAEVGISTSKLHARGPAGMDSLLSYKWILEGHGDTVGEYEKEKVKKYMHEQAA